jgi:hypothetical protein
MLPEFPKTGADILKYALMRITKRRIGLDPITNIGIQTIAHEGRGFSYEQEGTGIVTDSYHEFALPVEVKFSEVPTLIGTQFEEKLERLAEEQGKLMTSFVYSRIDAVIKQAGTGVDAGNKPISKELLLEVLDRGDLDFDKGGNPEGEWHCGPGMARHMAEQWEEWRKDPEFMAKYNELMGRKREAFLDRESNRKLVD